MGVSAQSTSTRISSTSTSTSLQILFTVAPSTSTSDTAASVSGSSNSGSGTGTTSGTRSATNITIATTGGVTVDNGPNAINTQTAVPSVFPSNSASSSGSFSPMQVLATSGLITWAALVL
ncbi:hypothetical protein FRC14_002906 [Serendipita sp. 396]|nr:hypothetical protein FRC14_002906 [Serendipita sp. 396]KAG8850276.1 hypothetical protein FRB91_009167 [Serendipita sp. 411]KAG9056692.1 hypothetical protein FS842_009859 [Serendipita sp. 407]